MPQLSKEMKEALDKIWTTGEYVGSFTIMALWHRGFVTMHPKNCKWTLTEAGLREWQKCFNKGSTCVLKRK